MLSKEEIEDLIEEKTEYIDRPVYKPQCEIARAQGFRQALCKVLGQKEPSVLKFNMDGIIKRALNRLEKECNFGIRIKE